MEESFGSSGLFQKSFFDLRFVFISFIFSQQESTINSDGCTSEFVGGNIKMMTTSVGERPGAVTGLLESGVDEATKTVNLCILRGDHWVWRKGSVELRWIPDMESLR